MACVLAWLLQVASPQDDLSKQAERAIRDEEGKGLFKLFGDEYRPTLEWEPGLIPVLLEGLKNGSHSVRFSIDRVFPRVAGFALIDLGGGTFECIGAENQRKVLEWLGKWWEKCKDRSRPDWFIDALGSSSLSMRRGAIEQLSALFDKSFGYEAEGDSASRRASIARWKEFWTQNAKALRWDEEKQCYATGPPATDEQAAKLKVNVARWIEELGDDRIQVREEATRSLIESGIPARPAIEEAVKSKDPEVQWRARAILEAQVPPSKRKAFQERAQALQQEGKIESEVKRLVGLNDLESAWLMLELCKISTRELGVLGSERASKDPQVAWLLARSIRFESRGQTLHLRAFDPPLGLVGLFSGSVQKLTPYLKDSSPVVRMAVAAIVSCYGSKHPEAVLAALSESDQRIRLSSVQALAQSGDLKAGKILLEHLKVEKDWDLRRWTVLALGRVKDESSIETLTGILRDVREHTFVSGAAAEALGLMGSVRGLPALLGSIESRKGDLEKWKDKYSRQYVLSYIAGSVYQILIANPESVEAMRAFEKVLGSEVEQVRLLALEKIEYTRVESAGLDKFIRELVGLAAKDESPEVREAAERILKKP